MHNASDDYEEWELETYLEIAKVINKQFKPHEIDVMVRIYRWTKSERNRFFFTPICKRIHNYKNAFKKLRSRRLIRVIRGNDPHKVTKDGIRVGRLMILCRELGYL
ncbi:hypothetical protein LCGC14_1447340 [marine sediment metagenome]|uniref:Uncharacterized protein n=1 Tax=marine sediment metagenome TaxID=412755 RepID=A0A0F9K583_9ZZZZ